MKRNEPMASTSAAAMAKKRHKQELDDQIHALEKLREKNTDLNFAIADGLQKCRERSTKKLREFLEKQKRELLGRPLQEITLDLEKPVDPAVEEKLQRDFEKKQAEMKAQLEQKKARFEQAEAEKEALLRGWEEQFDQ
ncbi:hypothetical protein M3Y99_00050000 [Aphelenchoides fujianensis]|nr:hypothetical protein M3Y99_00050000 [Aphelenchoides fujianensis]